MALDMGISGEKNPLAVERQSKSSSSSPSDVVLVETQTYFKQILSLIQSGHTFLHSHLNFVW